MWVLNCSLFEISDILLRRVAENTSGVDKHDSIADRDRSLWSELRRINLDLERV